MARDESAQARGQDGVDGRCRQHQQRHLANRIAEGLDQQESRKGRENLSPCAAHEGQRVIQPVALAQHDVLALHNRAIEALEQQRHRKPKPERHAAGDQEEMLVVLDAEISQQRHAAIGRELRRRSRACHLAHFCRRRRLGQKLQRQGLLHRLEIMIAHRHDESGGENAAERGEISRNDHAKNQHDHAAIGKGLLTQHENEKDRREGQKARNLPHGLHDAILDKGKARAFDRKIVDQRCPACKSQPVDEIDRHQKGRRIFKDRRLERGGRHRGALADRAAMLV